MSQKVYLGPNEKTIIIEFLKPMSTNSPDDLLLTNRESLCTKVKALLVSKCRKKGSIASTIARYASLIHVEMLARMVHDATSVDVPSVAPPQR